MINSNEYRNLKNPYATKVVSLSRGLNNYYSGHSRITLDKLFLRESPNRIGFVEGYHGATLLTIPPTFKNLMMAKNDHETWRAVVKNKSLSFQENMLLLAASYVSCKSTVFKKFHVMSTNFCLKETKRD